MTNEVTTVPDVLDEGRRLSGLFDTAGIRARLLGGVGVALHAHSAIPLVFQRAYGDLDYAVRRSDAVAFRRVLASNGYQANERFNAVHGARRLIFVDAKHTRQVDVFVGSFRMCHVLELEKRLNQPGPSLSPADLLLTKLQIISINEKDVLDTLLLVSEHGLGPEPEGIDGLRLSHILGNDWGWYTTVRDNLDKVKTYLASLRGIAPDLRDRTSARLAELERAVEAVRKSVAWRARALVGRRMSWFDEPEELG